jgi:hypothetical protein
MTNVFVLILSDNCRLALPTVTMPLMWARGLEGCGNKINETTGNIK